MDFTSFPPIAAVLNTAHTVVVAFSELLAPVAGGAAAALAVVLITVLVRAMLVPVAVSQVRAEHIRRRLAPKLAELRRRYGKKPDVLQRKTMELYAEEKTSPLAGCLPMLLQAPVLSTVYALFAFPVIAGRPNSLMREELLGVGLGDTLVGSIASGGAPLLVFAGVLLVIAAVAVLQRGSNIRFAQTAPAVAVAAATPAVFATDGPLSWLGLATVVVAAIVPLAAGLYLACSTTWSFAERAILRRTLAPR